MQVRIYAQTFSLTTAIERLISRQLSDKLAHYDDVVATDVFLKDLNGPKGGADKLVTMNIRLRDRRNVTIKAVNADLYRAIRLCVRGARRRVQASLGKYRQVVKAELRMRRRRADADPSSEVN